MLSKKMLPKQFVTVPGLKRRLVRFIPSFDIDASELEVARQTVRLAACHDRNRLVLDDLPTASAILTQAEDGALEAPDGLHRTLLADAMDQDKRSRHRRQLRQALTKRASAGLW